MEMHWPLRVRGAVNQQTRPCVIKSEEKNQPGYTEVFYSKLKILTEALPFKTIICSCILPFATRDIRHSYGINFYECVLLKGFTHLRVRRGYMCVADSGVSKRQWKYSKNIKWRF